MYPQLNPVSILFHLIKNKDILCKKFAYARSLLSIKNLIRPSWFPWKMLLNNVLHKTIDILLELKFSSTKIWFIHSSSHSFICLISCLAIHLLYRRTRAKLLWKLKLKPIIKTLIGWRLMEWRRNENALRKHRHMQTESHKCCLLTYM